MEFIELIDYAQYMLKKESEDESKSIFLDRYKKMMIYLEKVKIVYQEKRLKKDNVYLSVVKMLDHGDSVELQDAIYNVNDYYRKNSNII